jgi:hypothetical protein
MIDDSLVTPVFHFATFLIYPLQVEYFKKHILISTAKVFKEIQEGTHIEKWLSNCTKKVGYSAN